MTRASGLPPLERLIAALVVAGREPRRSGDHGTALCPAHPDSKPSLVIDRAEDGRVLVHCFALCPTEAVLAALGLAMADLYERSTDPLKATRSKSRRVRRRPLASIQDHTYAIAPRAVIETCDANCIKLFSYLDVNQGNNHRVVRGDAAIAESLNLHLGR